MKEWLKKLFAVDNTVNENTIVGFFLILVAVGGWFGGAPEFGFWGTLGGGLACFGLSVKKQL